MIKITQAKGFQLTFHNGLTLAVQIGPGNYCDNYDMDWVSFALTTTTNSNIQSRNAEVAIWDESGDWITEKFLGEGNIVVGYLTVDDIVDLIIKIYNYKK